MGFGTIAPGNLSSWIMFQGKVDKFWLFPALHFDFVLLWFSATQVCLCCVFVQSLLSYTHHCLWVEKTELCIFNCVLPTKGKHFYSSSESEEEEESHKKFNIKIKPLQAKDILKNAATVDELKASIGNIALSPSPVVSGFLFQALVRLDWQLCSAHTC